MLQRRLVILKHARFRIDFTLHLLLIAHLGNSAKASDMQSPRVPKSVSGGAHYRPDGVKIMHDPHAEDMSKRYGEPGKTDHEGFDPYIDTVGAGIYSGICKRDPATQNVYIGRQYQNHNPRPGPVYAGGGYTRISTAISVFRSQLSKRGGPELTDLGIILDEYPHLVNDVATGGATPLHTCGMSRHNQYAVEFLISRGANVDELDTYGYTPLHRMASNNLGHGARALLQAGADYNGLTSFKIRGVASETPVQIAMASHAWEAVDVFRDFRGQKLKRNNAKRVVVLSAGASFVLGDYIARPGTQIPESFVAVCEQNSWDPASTWKRLNGGEDGVWFAHENKSYIYFNAADGLWWIDGPDGLGVYTAPGNPRAPPCASTSWKIIDPNAPRQLPTLGVFRM